MQKITKLLIKGAIIVICSWLLVSCANLEPPTSGFGNPKKAKQYKNTGDLWQNLGESFNLPDETASNPAVRYEINWYMKHPEYVIQMAQQAKPYLYYIYQQVRKRGLPAELALMPMVESSYNPFAINNGSGASGLWQMMPSTASGFGLRVNWWYDGRRDVVASTNAALNYLSYLGSFFHNNWLLAMAAYDTGEGNVQAAIDRNAHAGKSISFWSLGLPKETQNYVPKILALATIIAHPYKYPINLPYLPNAPYLSKVNIGSQIDLARAAKMAGVSLKTLTELNPGYNRWATDPRGKHFLLLPVDNAARFKRALTGLPVKDRVTWHRVKIKEGDALYDIAKQYHTSPSLIAEVNHIKNNVIRPGQSLLIPDQKSGVTKLVINSERRYFGSLHKIPEPKVVHYEVKSGESLWQIAQKYHVAASEIRFWNGLRTNHIKPGTRLTIWPPHKKVSLYYTSWPYRVRKGDSLISIAKKYHTPILLLKKSNGIKGTEIRLGQVLRIPVAHYASRPHRKAAVRHTSKAPLKNSAHSTIYKVRSGDNLYKIAEKFKTSSKKISAENHLKNNMIKPGQLLRV